MGQILRMTEHTKLELLRVPFSSLTVAYWLFARGQVDLLHRPVKLYSFLQNFWLFVLECISENQ